ncbi:hypothetical protein [Natronoglomus mannanivorans]|uniref:Uncharacterized protein n=1 Tax=Natronoglomus mannanivorans TaxID=2979990 RepID=A0AAP2Z2V8_9EURY|nr:hypothetical protein [Halobacteria archaeon AArc-xg1-1]
MTTQTNLQQFSATNEQNGMKTIGTEMITIETNVPDSVIDKIEFQGDYEWEYETGVDALDHWLGTSNTRCNQFAWGYVENVDSNATVRVITIDGATVEHCVVYDRELDITIDATLTQFDAGADIGVYAGEEHPHMMSFYCEYEVDEYDGFEDDWEAGGMGPFYL